MNQKTIPEEFFTLQEAANYMHIKRQAVYAALKKGRLTSKRVNRNHVFTRKQLDEYRADKFNRENRLVDGEKVYDFEKGLLSVNHVAKTISAMLRRPYALQRIYYLIHIGELKAYKKGGTWVIHKEDAKSLYDKESQEDARQMRFA